MTVDTSFTRHVVIGDRRLYVEYMDRVGQDRPTVVFVAGAGNDCTTWDDVFLDVASFARVFRYDRPGLGQSDPASGASIASIASDDLDDILVEADVPGPYVLVGHSFGGLIASLYAHRKINKVCGLVLMDTSHPDQRAKMGALLPSETPDESESIAMLRRIFLAPEVEFGSERVDMAASFAQVRSISSLGDMRLVVLTGQSTFAQTPDIPAELAEQLDDRWQALQRDWLNLSSQSTQIIAEKSGHRIHRDQPQVVIDAIRAVVDQVQKG